MNCSRTACKLPLGDDEYYVLWNEPSTEQPRLYCFTCGKKIVAYNPTLEYEIRSADGKVLRPRGPSQ